MGSPLIAMRPKWKRLFHVVLRTTVIGYLFALGVLMFFERSMIYPIPDRKLGDWNPPGLVYEDVWLEAKDGTKLHAWYLPHDHARATVLYFHGNGEHIPWCGPLMSQCRDDLAINVLVVDYRGYGKSEGKPSERLLIEDGILAAHWLAERESIPVEQLVLWGRSIGGGVAAGVAESVHPRAMIMECTFDSLVDVAATHVPWVPVRWLMSNKYPSAQRLKDYQGEFLQWHGDRDSLVPLASAKRLFAAVPSAKKTFTLAVGSEHNDEAPQQFKNHLRKLLGN
jgi:fermentation-respiration switch protein FrsA (DUF1100 family)